MDQKKHEQIAARAYALWQAEGQPDGRHEEHWYRASGSYWPRPGSRPNPMRTRLPSGAAILNNNSKCRPIGCLGGADQLDACVAPSDGPAMPVPGKTLWTGS